MTPPKNISASVRRRLFNRSKAENRPFNELLHYYAMERFLYRLSISERARSYILKGALMLRVWNAPDIRPTMDIDMLGRERGEGEEIASQIREILELEVDSDGLRFDPESIRTERILENADYQGVRVRFNALLENARINMRLDIGFGDIVYPKPEKAELPCILDSPVPSLLCYSRESVVAEKFEAMIKLGRLNSRMKDFYDIWLLSTNFDFELAALSEAIKLTFKRRGAELIEPIDAFSIDFISSRQSMWSAFRKRLNRVRVPETFQEAATKIEVFLRPTIKGAPGAAVWLSESGSWFWP